MQHIGDYLNGAFSKPPAFYKCSLCGSEWTSLTTDGTNKTKEGLCLDCFEKNKKKPVKPEKPKPSFFNRRTI